jgi:hypothetical protein
MVRRIADEISGYVVELGTDGRLLSLQLDELIAGVEPERELVARDYVPQPGSGGRRSRTVPEALSELDRLTHSELLELATVARALGYSGAPETLDSGVSPRGFRLLAKVPRLPTNVIALGELGLSGELRPVPDLGRRLAEAARLGFRRAIVPAGSSNDSSLDVIGVRDLSSALVAVDNLLRPLRPPRAQRGDLTLA